MKEVSANYRIKKGDIILVNDLDDTFDCLWAADEKYGEGVVTFLWRFEERASSKKIGDKVENNPDGLSKFYKVEF